MVIVQGIRGQYQCKDIANPGRPQCGMAVKGHNQYTAKKNFVINRLPATHAYRASRHNGWRKSAGIVSQLHIAKHEITSSIIGLKVTRNDQFSLINYFS